MTSSSTPAVSIGLPVYNGENYLEAALQSLVAQTFTDFEIVVSDNASTDRTEEIVRDYADSDHRIRYFRNAENVGANPNYNRTFALSRGDYFRWHAHDDVCDPKYLEMCLNVLRDDPSAVLCHSTTRYIDRNGDELLEMKGGFLDPDGFIERLHADPTAPALLASDHAPDRLRAVAQRMTVFFDIFGLVRRDAMRQTLLLRNYYGADKVLLAEFALMGRMIRIDEPLFMRRCHREASTRSTSMKALASWSESGRAADFYPALIITGYLDAIRTADLSPDDRRACYRIVASKVARNPYGVLRGR